MASVIVDCLLWLTNQQRPTNQQVRVTVIGTRNGNNVIMEGNGLELYAF